MSQPTHLDFTQDKVPAAELENPSTHTDFDWEELVRRVEGDLEDAQKELSESDYKRLKERLVLILAWVFSGRDNGNKGWKHSVANRAIAMGAVLCPNFLLEDGQARLAEVMKVSKQAAGELKRDAIEHLMWVATQTERTKRKVKVS